METRRLILAAAKEFYSVEANAEAPISRLALKAGVAEGTVFVYFPDKPSLIAAALEEEFDEMLATAWNTLPKDSPCREQLLHLAQVLYSFYSLRPALFRVLIKESLFLQGEWGTRVLDYVIRFVAKVAGLIDEAKARGEYRSDVDSLLAARSFYGLYLLELIGALNEDVFDPLEILDRLRATVMQLETGLQSGKEKKT